MSQHRAQEPSPSSTAEPRWPSAPAAPEREAESPPGDPLRRLRRRVLLVSAPLVFIFAVTDRMVLHGPAFWAAFGVRVAWGTTLVGAALWLPRVGAPAERRLLTAVGFSTPLFFGVLAAMTGRMGSPLFQFIVAMPVVVALVVQDQPVATSAAVLAMLASGLVIVGYDTRSLSMMAAWTVQAAAMGALAVFASVAYRRLRLRLDAARRAEVLAAERARLFQSEVAARDDFLSVASHELKTPMTSLLLQVESLGRLARGASTPGIPPEEVAAKQKTIARQTRRLATLVDTLLDATRIQSGKLEVVPEDVDIVEVVRGCLLSFEAEAAIAGSTIELKIAGAPAQVNPGQAGGVARDSIHGRWDPARLEQILGNLLANAIRYGMGKPIEVRLSAAAEEVTMTVRDRGVGIAAADHQRIFQRFERVVNERTSGGLGLGLWITQQLVDAMGGRVLLTSAPSEGSTFTIALPRQTKAATVRVGRRESVHSAG